MPDGDGREWDLWIIVRAGPVLAARRHFPAEELARLRAAQLALPGGAMLRAFPTGDGHLRLQRCERWLAAGAASLHGTELELSGMLHGLDGRGLEIEVSGASARAAVSVDRVHWSATLDAASLPAGEPAEWPLRLRGDDTSLPVLLAASHAPQAWDLDGAELALLRSREGTASLRTGAPHAVLEEARWEDGGALELSGTVPFDAPAGELVLVSATLGFRRAWPLVLAGGRFTATITPAGGARVLRRAAAAPWPVGARRACGRRAGRRPDTAMWAGPALRHRLPPGAVLDGKPYELRMTATDSPCSTWGATSTTTSAGAFHQRRLRDDRLPRRRAEPLRDAVVYTSFRGRQYSDSPRAIHEELVRRGAPLEHLWVVARRPLPRAGDARRVAARGQPRALRGARPARYVVANDHFPEWFQRRPRPGVRCRPGTARRSSGSASTSSALRRRRVRKFERDWDEQVRNWQYVLSPNRFSTPILRRAYRLEGEMLETGYPRNDVLAGADRDAPRPRLRAPARASPTASARCSTRRPTATTCVDRRGRYRLDLHARPRAAARGARRPDTVLLFRKHHYIVDAVPATRRRLRARRLGLSRRHRAAAGRRRAGHGLLVDDGRLREHRAGRCCSSPTTSRSTRDEIRGFYFDFEATVPGPLLRTTDELAEALRDLDARARRATPSATRRSWRRFCELDDGGAAGAWSSGSSP